MMLCDVRFMARYVYYGVGGMSKFYRANVMR
jgi:hypothetical protein